MSLSKTIGYAWNLISLIGMVLAVTAASLIVVFFSFEMISGVEHAYLGIMTYFIFPGMLVFGLLLVPWNPAFSIKFPATWSSLFGSTVIV